MRAVPAKAALALALAALALPAVLGDRELFTLDCQLQVHVLAGTPLSFSGGANAVDGLFNHAVNKFRERLKCHCSGDGMAADEFNRKYHPFPALFNLISKSPKLDRACDTEWDVLRMYDEWFREPLDDLRRNVDTRSASFDGAQGLLPCSYGDVAPGGKGCTFKLKSTVDAIDIDLGIAVKTCPNSDVPFISVVLQGGWADNMFKPCNAEDAKCSAGLECKDITEIGRRRQAQGLDYITQPLPQKYQEILRSVFARFKPPAETTKRVGLRALIKEMGADDLVDNITTRVKKYFEKSQILSSLRAAYHKLTGQHAPTSPTDTVSLLKDTLTDMIIDVGDQLRSEQQQLRRALNKPRGRGLLAWSANDQRSVNSGAFDFLKNIGFYGGKGPADGEPEDGGCLPMSTIVARARAFSGIFFPDATVDASMTPSLDFCVPPLDSLESFGRDNFGITVTQNGDEPLIKVPIHTWDGAMSRSRNVFSADRLDGSAFVGAADALKPPAIDQDAKIVPVWGTTCSGASYLQIGDKFGFSGMASGMTSIIDFALEQVASMQTCRAKKRDGSFIMSRITLLSFFGAWAPMWAIKVLTIPVAGQELGFDMFGDKVKEPWKAGSEGIEMYTPMNRMVRDEWKLTDEKNIGFQLDFADVRTCTAKGYPTKGCMMAADIKMILPSLKSDHKAIMGVKQCFSTAKIVPLSAEGFALQGDVAMAASPIKTCIRGADCPTNFNCRTDLSGPLIEDANWDAFGFLIYGEGWESGQTCASQWGETNKLVAEMLEFYTGTEQSSTVFGFCIPTVEINLDLDQLVETKPGANGVTEIKVKALGPFEGTLPGVADQKNVILVFPPSASERYTWPQEQARRVQWVTFNIPSGTAMTAKLMKGGAEVKSVTLSQDEANMFSKEYEMPVDIAPGTGYYIELCAEGKCWKSGQFEVVEKKENLPEPVAYQHIVLGDPEVLKPGSEALSVFLAAQVPNIAMTLNVATHRLEVTGISAVTSPASRREETRALAVQMRIHPDVTGQDTKTPTELVEDLNNEDKQAALTANNGVYLSSAQSSDASLTTLTNDEYSDVEKQQKVKKSCDAGQCSYDNIIGEAAGGLSTAAIIGIAVGASVGGCCLCVCCAAAVYFLFVKTKNGASGATPPVASQPAPPQGIMPQAPAAPAFCSECGTPGDGGAFCGKCGAALSATA